MVMMCRLASWMARLPRRTQLASIGIIGAVCVVLLIAGESSFPCSYCSYGIGFTLKGDGEQRFHECLVYKRNLATHLETNLYIELHGLD